jgi:hypothetical protein
VSDFGSGTVANISGTVTQSQVTSLTSDLAGKASTSAPTITGFTTLQATPGIGTDTPVTVLGGTGQSVPLQSWKTVALVALSSVDQNGYGNFARVSAGQSTDLGYSAALSVNTTGTATKGLVIRGAAALSANLQEWQNSAGGTVARISSGGSATFPNVNSVTFVTSNNELSITAANSGGQIQIKKATASSAPGTTDYARICIVDGTNAGTLKLVIRAGTLGAQTTILDNIPQS